jgi:phage shock protein C
MTTTTRLMRDPENRMLGGVCAGIARRWGWDPTLVRVAFVLLGVFSAGLAAVLYVAAWVIMPAGSDADAGSAHPIGDEFRDAGDRAAEATRILVRAAKSAATEVADVARRPSPLAGSYGAPAASPANETPSASVASTEGTPAAEATPESGESQSDRQPPAAV